MAYEILISDEQKDMIRSALSLLQTSTPLYERHHEQYKELKILQRLFDDLKDDETNYCVNKEGRRVHITHGFCL